MKVTIEALHGAELLLYSSACVYKFVGAPSVLVSWHATFEAPFATQGQTLRLYTLLVPSIASTRLEGCRGACDDSFLLVGEEIVLKQDRSAVIPTRHGGLEATPLLLGGVNGEE